MAWFCIGFTTCYAVGGLCMMKFVSDQFADSGRAAPAAGLVVTFALWPRMLWVVGRDQ